MGNTAELVDICLVGGVQIGCSLRTPRPPARLLKLKDLESVSRR